MLSLRPDPPHDPVMKTSHHVLVADDDRSTREFLSAALRSLGHRPVTVVDGEEALARATLERFDVLLLDCRMPGRGALDVLGALRGEANAASRDTPALASSAEISPAQRATLLAAGFAGVMEKPCRVATLAALLATIDGPASTVKRLDDHEAMQATGDAQTMQALRGLLKQELLQLDGELDGMALPDLVERLHKLRSACGFCGTTRLGAEVRALQIHIDMRAHVAQEALSRFRDELRATLAALQGTPS